jgi:hypothetical protein
VNTGSLSTALQKGLEIKPYSGTAGSTGEVRFNALTGANYVGFKSPDAIPASRIWTLPSADGASGHVLSTNGSGTMSWIAIPSAPVSSVAGRTGAVTLTAADVIGTVAVANGGTGAATLANNGILVGAGSLPVSTVTGAQYQVLQAGAGGAPAFGALNLNQSAAVTGSLAITNGGTGATTNSAARTNLGAAASGANSDITSLSGLTTALSVSQGGTGATWLVANNVLLGNGTGAPLTVAPSTDGNVLMANGTTWTSAAIPWGSPGAIGVTTPSSGAFTSVVSNAQIGYELKPYNNAAGSTGELRFDELTANGINYVGFKSPDNIVNNLIWTLPAADGSNGQVLSTNGNGITSWMAIPAAPVSSVAGRTGAVTLTASDVSGTVAVTNGGTGATTNSGARTNLGAAASGANSDITSLTGLTTALSVAQGGTGATSLAANNVLLGNGTSAPLTLAPTTNGNVLMANGTTWTSAAIPWGSPGAIGASTPSSGAFTSLTTSGNIGIGSSSPTARLDVNGESRVGAAPATLTTVSGAHTAAVTTISVVSTTGYPSAGTLLIKGEAVSYTGTTSNTFTGCTRGVLGTTAVAFTGNETVDVYLSIERTSAATPRVAVTASGNVGIGTTTPGSRLEVVSSNNNFFDGLSVRPNNLTTTLSFGWQGINSTVDLALATSGSERMRVTTGGNVGIGATAPTATLHVAGTAQFDGDVTGVDNRQQVFRLKSGTFSTSGAGWTNFTGASGTASIIIGRPIVWIGSIAGHYVDVNDDYPNFRFAFTNNANGNITYIPDTSGIRKYIYISNNRLEEVTLTGVSSIPKGTYTVQLQINKTTSATYNWNGTYGEVSLVIW